MKKIILLILTIIPIIGMAQQSPEIPKNSDKIVVTNTNTAEQNFIKAKQALADRDIAIGSQDRDIFQINTGKIRQTDNASYTYLINCRDGKISITGTWSSNIGMNVGSIQQGASTYSIKYKGAEKFIFNQMDAFAKELGTEIHYEVTQIMVKQKKNVDDVYQN